MRLFVSVALLLGTVGRALAFDPEEQLRALDKVGVTKPLHKWEMQGITQVIGFLPDGKTLVGLQQKERMDHSIVFWDVESGKRLREWNNPLPRKANRATLSRDGKLLAIAYNNDVAVFDLATEKTVWTKNKPHYGSALVGVDFSPDSKVLATSCQGGRVCVWDSATGNRKHEFSTRGDELFPEMRSMWVVKFAPDGKTIVAGAQDRTIFVWDVETAKLVARMQPDRDGAYGPTFALSPDGKMLATGFACDPTIRLWHLPLLTLRSRLVFDRDYRENIPGGARVAILELAWGPSGHFLAAGGSNGLAVLWETVSGLPLQRMSGFSVHVHSLVFSFDGRYVAAGDGKGAVCVWNAAAFRAPLESAPKPFELEERWRHLQSMDAEAAQRAVAELAKNANRSTPFLLEKLSALPGLNMGDIKRWFGELDDPKFEVREKAEKELQRLGAALLFFVHQKKFSPHSQQQERALKRLTARVETQPYSPDEVRCLRALQALEEAKTDDAVKTLNKLTERGEFDWLAERARRALARLDRTRDKMP